jgi:hypothetical protein
VKLSPLAVADFRDDPLLRDRLGDMTEFAVAAAESHREGPRLLLTAPRKRLQAEALGCRMQLDLH